MVYQLHIHQIECPICKNTGQYIKTDFEVICTCGYVLITPYPYVAGKRINTDLETSQKKNK